MRLFATRLGWGFCSLVFLAAGTAYAQKIRPGEYLMPSSAQGFLAVTNVEILIAQYNKTELGKLTSDPVMEPFTKDMERQFESRWSGVHERLGLTLEDLRELAGGEVSVALIKPDEDPLRQEPTEEESTSAQADVAVLALVVDVTGRLDVAKKKLEEITTHFRQQGAKHSMIKVDACPQPVLEFELPIPEEERNAAASKYSGASPVPTGNSRTMLPQKPEPKPQMAYYFLAGNLFGAVDNKEMVEGILARIYGREGDALADIPGFQKVMERCQADLAEPPPQIRWFMYPVGYAAAMRAATAEEKRRKGKSILEVLRNQGFMAVKGIGGCASFAAEGYDLVHRTAVYAPYPDQYVKSMKMLVFHNGKDYRPQPWVPRDIATYTTFYFDVLNAFDNFGPFFDEFYGAGDEGVWLDTLDNLKLDPYGAQIDLREELFKFLNERVTVLTDYQTPIEVNSERILIAIDVRDEKAVAKAIDKSMRGDSGAKHREIDGLQIWEIVEPEGPKIKPPTLIFGEEMPNLSAAAPKAPPMQARFGQGGRVFPHAAITVTKGHLFIASHLDFLLKVMQDHEQRELLINEIDYQLVKEEIDRLKPEEKCLRFFSRTEEEYRPTYELVRQNKMPESENMLARMLNALFGEGKQGLKRQPKLDGSQLPEYDVVRRYLRPAGMQVTAEEDGWFLKGFTLAKENGDDTTEEKASPKEPPSTEEKPPAEEIAVEEPSQEEVAPAEEEPSEAEFAPLPPPLGEEPSTEKEKPTTEERGESHPSPTLPGSTGQ